VEDISPHAVRDAPQMEYLLPDAEDVHPSAGQSVPRPEDDATHVESAAPDKGRVHPDVERFDPFPGEIAPRVEHQDSTADAKWLTTIIMMRSLRRDFINRFCDAHHEVRT
jgi:hypothetical protein